MIDRLLSAKHESLKRGHFEYYVHVFVKVRKLQSSYSL